MFNLSRLCVQRTVCEYFKLDKRFKGHSKWQNIRHIKAEKDQEKSLLFAQLTRRMKAAIADGGNDPNPKTNSKLSIVIDEAIRKNMPSSTISGFLDKMSKSKQNSKTDFIDFRGPGGSVFLMKILSDHVLMFRQNCNTIFRKNSCANADGKLKSAFDHIGFVDTEINNDLDRATEDAINVGADEVEEIHENNEKIYRFTCHPQMLYKIKQQLQDLNYNIILTTEDFVPRSVTSLSDEDLKKVDILCAKLNALEEVIIIYHNIELPDEGEEKEAAEAKR